MPLGVPAAGLACWSDVLLIPGHTAEASAATAAAGPDRLGMCLGVITMQLPNTYMSIV